MILSFGSDTAARAFAGRARRSAAFTLVELMLSMAVFALLLEDLMHADAGGELMAQHAAKVNKVSQGNSLREHGLPATRECFAASGIPLGILPTI